MSMSTTTDALSLRSMTRASTHSARGSDMLPTPQDDHATFNLPQPKHRIESSSYSEPPHIEDIFVNHPPYGTPPRQGLVPPHLSGGRHEWRSYSSDDVGTFQVRSTRDLIGMYESNRSSGDVPTTRTNPYALPSPRRDSPLPPSPANTFPKNKLPLRESFRNLLHAFGKKKDRKDDIGAGPYIPAPAPPPSHGPQHLQVAEAELRARMRSSDTVETFSIAREGPLLHLNTRAIPPRWHACDATLHASHMNLRWSEADGHASVHDMVLALCTNVKSVAANAIDPAMSPVFGNNETAHVFVMEFESGEERFATSTVTERVAWVNALWDGILRCRDVSSSHSTEHIEQQDTGSSVAPAEPPMVLRVVNSPSPDSSMSEGPPRNSRFVRSHTPTSPSLGRLDSENLVKQRLAQYEQKFGSSVSSWKSSGPSIYSLPAGESQRGVRPSAQDKHDEMMSGGDEPFNAMHSALDAAFWGGARHRKAASEQPPAFSTMRRADSIRSKSSLQRHATTATIPPPPIEKDIQPFSSEVTVTLKNIGRNRPDSVAGGPSPIRPELTRTDSDNSSVVDLQPLYSLLRQQSTSQASSTEHVSSQIGSMRDDLSKLIKDVQSAIASASPSPQLERLESQFNALCARMDLQPLHDKLDKLADPAVQSMANVARRDRPLPPILDFGPVLSSLDDLKRKTRPQPPTDYTPVLDKMAVFEGLQHADHVAVMQKLDELRAAMVAREDLNLVTTMLNDASSRGQHDGIDQPAVGLMLAEILEKLNTLGLSAPPARGHSPAPSTLQSIPSETGLTTVYASPTLAQPGDEPDVGSNIATKANSPPGPQETPAEQQVADPPKDDAEDARHADVMTELQQIATVMKGLSTSSTLLGSQHTDSIRYLGELNKWLEAFVKNTTMQVDGIHAGIGRLSHELGIPPVVPIQQPPPQPPQEGEPPVQTLGNVGTDPSAPATEAPPPGGILQEMRQYLAENKGRQQQTQAELQAAMQALVAGAAQDIDTRANDRQKAASDALFAFMEQQRQANEALLRGIATELSNDIRGERLRFVDAMKEATTVNIQFHVEEFKKQLTKEVLTMTIEVERLQRERQMLQMQISELFAFFSKQKQALALPQGQGAPESRPLPQEPPAVQVMANLPPRRRRA